MDIDQVTKLLFLFRFRENFLNGQNDVKNFTD
jgi:hypothetical protein